MFALLAYVAFITLLVSAGARAGKGAGEASERFSAEANARAECSFAAYFALDGKNAAIDLGKNPSASNASKCKKTVTRFAEVWEVSENAFEPV